MNLKEKTIEFVETIASKEFRIIDVSQWSANSKEYVEVKLVSNSGHMIVQVIFGEDKNDFVYDKSINKYTVTLEQDPEKAAKWINRLIATKNLLDMFKTLKERLEKPAELKCPFYIVPE